MKRYGQRLITLKDMLVEHLLEHLGDGVTFDALKKALGASEYGLKRLLVEMERDGELIRVKSLMTKAPNASTVPFATQPVNQYIRGPRFRPIFGRVLTPCFTQDVDELRTHAIDVSELLADNAIAESEGWSMPRSDEALKLSPRMWIEQVASA